MAVTAMNHFTILTDDVARTVAFYRDLLGLDDGERPASAFPARGSTPATRRSCT